MRTRSETDATFKTFMKHAFEAAQPHVEEVQAVPDVWSWLHDSVFTNIFNIMSGRSWRVALGQDGWARLWWRDNMSDETPWNPQPAGFRLLKSVPEGRPFLVGECEKEDWGEAL